MKHVPFLAVALGISIALAVVLAPNEPKPMDDSALVNDGLAPEPVSSLTIGDLAPLLSGAELSKLLIGTAEAAGKGDYSAGVFILPRANPAAMPACTGQPSGGAVGEGAIFIVGGTNQGTSGTRLCVCRSSARNGPGNDGGIVTERHIGDASLMAPYLWCSVDLNGRGSTCTGGTTTVCP